MRSIVTFLFWLVLFCAAILIVVGAQQAFGQSGALIPPIYPVFVNTNGITPVANGFVCTTTTGTTNPLATYLDSSLMTANANPITLSSAGRAVSGSTLVPIYLQAAQYRITLYAAGTQNLCNGQKVGALVWQRDNVYDVAQLLLSGAISPATFNVINVKDINNRIMCDTQAGADAGLKISACVTAATAAGKIADATGMTGTLTSSTSIGITGGVCLELPSNTITFSVPTAFHLSGTAPCLIGQGSGASIIRMNPSMDGTAISVTSGGSSTPYAKLHGFTLDATGNTGFVKKGILVSDGEEVEISDIAISNWHDTTNSSEGIQLSGRQSYDVHNIANFADKPFHIALDPNTMIVALDHSHFYNIYACNCINGAAVATNPVWTIDDGVWLTNDTWDGYQAWVGGTYGFYYSSAGEAVTGYNNRISNCRTEQSTNAAGFGIYFAPGNASTFGTKIENCYLSAPVAMGGIYLRNQVSARIAGNTYGTTGGVVLNADSTVYYEVENNLLNLNAGATLSVTGSNPSRWCGNDRLGANAVTPRCGFGVPNPTNYVVIPNDQSFAGLTGGGVEVPIAKIDTANSHIELDPGAVAAYFNGTLSLAGDRATNGNPLVVANSKWLAGTDNAAAAKGMVEIDTSGHVTLGEDPTKNLVINPSTFCFGGAAGTCITRAIGVPNGVVTGFIGDLYINLNGGAGTTFYVKEAGNGTNTNWVGK